MFLSANKKEGITNEFVMNALCLKITQKVSSFDNIPKIFEFSRLKLAFKSTDAVLAIFGTKIKLRLFW